MDKECYAVDLDGTLAEYTEWKGSNHIGKPIPLMVNKIKGWIAEGIEVIIFTARADDPDNIPPIEEWLNDNGLPNLDITNIKTPNINRIYDDRAIQVSKNTGKVLGDEKVIEFKFLGDKNKTSSKLMEIYSE